MPEDTYGHTPARKAFELMDVYGVGFDAERAARKQGASSGHWHGGRGAIEVLASDQPSTDHLGTCRNSGIC